MNTKYVTNFIYHALQKDCMGHGTLVTSIAAGYEGIAPQANIGAYRVFGCYGEATDDVIIAAMERAVLDGMDIINLSVSDRSGYPEVRRLCTAGCKIQVGSVL